MQGQLSHTQKAGFVLLLVFGLVTVGMGFLQMRNTIYGPFALRASKTATGAATFEDEATRAQRSDTDHDGINDYEEVNFYQTSAYLPDTDSDGASDKEEIDAGSDPLCPKEEGCQSAASDVAPSSASSLGESATDGFGLLDAVVGALPSGGDTAASDGGTLPSGVAGVTPGTAASGGSATDINALVNNAAALREILRKTGKFTEEQLAKIPDETLLRMAGEVVAEQPPSKSP